MCGSLVQLRPLANKMFRAVATARAADVGRAGVLGTCWPLRARIGEPTHSYEKNCNYMASSESYSGLYSDKAYYYQQQPFCILAQKHVLACSINQDSIHNFFT